MRAAVVTAPNHLELREIPLPQPGSPYDCLVKIDACAICSGTDSAIAFGDFPWRADYPFVLGHESTGLILECGAKVRNFQAGQRVTRPGAVLSGQRVGGLGSTWGGYAEYGLVRDTRASAEDGLAVDGMQASSRTPLPEGVDPVSAALSINQREILSVAARMPLDPDSRVVVIGSGYNGLLFSLLCKHFGAGKVVMLGSARLEERAIQQFGADGYADYRLPDSVQSVRRLLEGKPTHIIDAVGSRKSLRQAESLINPRTLFGCYGIEEIHLTGELRGRLETAYPQLDMSTREADCAAEWHALWQAGFFDRPGMCDRVMPLEDIKAAFSLIARREAVKVVLTM